MPYISIVTNLSKPFTVGILILLSILLGLASSFYLAQIVPISVIYKEPVMYFSASLFIFMLIFFVFNKVLIRNKLYLFFNRNEDSKLTMTVSDIFIIMFTGLLVFYLQLQIYNIYHSQKALPTLEILYEYDIYLIVILLFIEQVIITPLWEEVAFRGLLFSSFSQYSKYQAFIIPSIIWALVHTLTYDGFFLTLINFTLFGLILSYWRFKTNSITPCIVIHSFVNLFWFFSVSSL